MHNGTLIFLSLILLGKTEEEEEDGLIGLFSFFLRDKKRGGLFGPRCHKEEESQGVVFENEIYTIGRAAD